MVGPSKGSARGRNRGPGVDPGAPELGEEFVLILGETFAGVEKLIEAADEGFVVST